LYLHVKRYGHHCFHTGWGLERALSGRLSTSLLDSLQSCLANALSVIVIAMYQFDIVEVLSRPLLGQHRSDQIGHIVSGY
jgi:hypothetical protein